MPSRHWSGFILPGATFRDRVWACCGALVGIGLTALLSTALFSGQNHIPLLVAPIGASAVLVFAVPASPLAQPWSVIGGNTISALIGVATSYAVRDPMIAVGISVSFAIAAMSLTRCLHPPGGAAALTAVLASHTALVHGLLFPLVPVALNSVLLVFFGWIFHKFTHHAYPHNSATDPLPASTSQIDLIRSQSEFESEDLEAALKDFGEPLDIQPGDLRRLFKLVEQRAKARERRNGDARPPVP